MPDLYLHEEGYYVAQFYDTNDMNEILFSRLTLLEIG